MSKPATGDTYDLIVIGSGMSGLATASLIAQFCKKRVLVLEAHFTLGGFLHSFKRKGYEWDPGFHYVGDMEEGTQTRGCMDLVTGRKRRLAAARRAVRATDVSKRDVGSTIFS